jgi:Tol biopolymer transport system component
VVFSSSATNLVPINTQGIVQVFVRDRQQGTTEVVSVATGGALGDLPSHSATISDNGRYVAFVSEANNLVLGDTNNCADVFVRDRQGGTTERVSVDSNGVEANYNSGTDIDACVSADGRFVAFASGATNLVPGDTNGRSDIFVHDRQLGSTKRVSVDSSGTQANDDSYGPWISASGRYVVFESPAANLVTGDTNGTFDVFVRDRRINTTERISLGPGGVQGNGSSAGLQLHASADGRYVMFTSVATNLVPGDTNGAWDVFVRDRFGGTTFTSFCDSGVGGVIACPCSNAPSGLGRGCDNSSGTGGAVLSASGGTFLSSDSLVFTTSGEKPTALSILSQWTGVSATGAIFGMGVRCTSGTFKHLYTKSAVGGSITAPDFGAGDPQVSVRSAALGDTSLTGQSRWYLVLYRDPIVLGGCPATSTFNATQTGSASWSP